MVEAESADAGGRPAGFGVGANEGSGVVSTGREGNGGVVSLSSGFTVRPPLL